MLSRESKTSKVLLVLRTCENSDDFNNTLDEIHFGIHLKKVNIPYVWVYFIATCCDGSKCDCSSEYTFWHKLDFTRMNQGAIT